jgi:hypothetical protein
MACQFPPKFLLIIEMLRAETHRSALTFDSTMKYTSVELAAESI